MRLVRTVGTSSRSRVQRIRRRSQPNLDWRTLKTQHFLCAFQSRDRRRWRAASPRTPNGRTSQLSNEMHPPRGMIDIVISDDVDLSNGSATPYADEPHHHLRQSAGVGVRASLHE